MHIPNNQAILGGIVLGLVLSDEALAGIVVGLALTTSPVLGLETRVVGVVLDELGERHCCGVESRDRVVGRKIGWLSQRSGYPQGKVWWRGKNTIIGVCNVKESACNKRVAKSQEPRLYITTLLVRSKKSKK